MSSAEEYEINIYFILKIYLSKKTVKIKVFEKDCFDKKTQFRLSINIIDLYFCDLIRNDDSMT